MIGNFIFGCLPAGALGLFGKFLLSAGPKFLAKALRCLGFGGCAAMALFLVLTGLLPLVCRCPL